MDGAPGENPVKLIHYVTLGVWLYAGMHWVARGVLEALPSSVT